MAGSAICLHMFSVECYLSTPQNNETPFPRVVTEIPKTDSAHYLYGWRIDISMAGAITCGPARAREVKQLAVTDSILYLELSPPYL